MVVLRVDRAFALNTHKHLALAGRYPRLLALPDRWQSWIAGGVIKGLARIRADRPDAIMSTYPIASAHASVLWPLTSMVFALNVPRKSVPEPIPNETRALGASNDPSNGASMRSVVVPA